MLDLDHFKGINDIYRHATDNTVLFCVAYTIHKLIRHNNQLCRYGEEEFTMIFPGMLLMEIENAINRIKDAISRISFTSEDNPVFNVTASTGVVALKNHSNSFSSPQEMLKAAYQVLYTAKRNDRIRVFLWHNTLNP
ncbi:diguanylate cyclase (GGDEF) domain-containing protein [Nitrosomonas aestuarii]|uniref:diguanylate cyclase n=1 Tax=Nitrosomonas aestuarii TaxID=52441 RepID=A0A1I4FGX0_9PROT|nr:diguanylate cyclase (GGDEF) domain-containing protein [Nitrosomonas aestuarii]